MLYHSLSRQPEVIFDLFKIVSSYTKVDLQVLLICSYFTTTPGGREGGRTGAEGNKIKANSAQLNLAGAWAELGNRRIPITKKFGDHPYPPK
jgi:hypothetical protein